MRKRQRCILIITMLSLSLMGCNNEAIPNGYYNYNRGEVETAADQLSFQPDLPEYIPIQVETVVSDRFLTLSYENEALDISFYTLDNDLLSIHIVNGEIEDIPIATEKVTIQNNVDGIYVINSFHKALYWEKEGISYKLTYQSKSENGDDVTKADLINVASSFHS